MINIIITKRHSYTFDSFFEAMPDCKGSINFLFYDDFPYELSLIGSGPIIFVDLDRLDSKTRSGAIKLADRLLLDGRLVLNHPSHFNDRYSLLIRLHQAGLNHFRAYRVFPAIFGRGVRYPLFLRKNSGHTGNLNELAAGRHVLLYQVARQFCRAAMGKVSLRDVIAVEFQPVARQSGQFAKFSYLKIGDELIARHVFFSNNWVVKGTDLYEEDNAKEEVNFLANRPHAEKTQRVFQLAGIDYGRIDYSIDPATGKIQVWEINTNPSLASARHKNSSARNDLQNEVLRSVADAFFRLENLSKIGSGS